MHECVVLIGGCSEEFTCQNTCAEMSDSILQMETVVDVPKTEEAEVLESMKARWNDLGVVED